MTTKVEKSIVVNVPLSTVYNQWTQFEDFPQFMGGVKSITQQDDNKLHWVAEIAGVKREWEAVVLEQVPDQKIAWAATSGATNAGAVHFSEAGAGATSVTLSLEYEPEGIVETVGDKLNIVGKQAESDLEKFKKFIESEGYATGAWRGSVNEGAGVGTPGVEAAAASQGDSGKSGLSAKSVVAGVAAAAAGVAAATALSGKSDDKPDTVDTTTAPPVPSATITSVETTSVPAVDTTTDVTSDDSSTTFYQSTPGTDEVPLVDRATGDVTRDVDGDGIIQVDERGMATDSPDNDATTGRPGGF